MKAFLAVSVAPGSGPGPFRTPRPDVIARLPGGPDATTVRVCDGWLAGTVPDPADEIDTATGRCTVRLGRPARTRAGDVPTAALAAMLGDGTAAPGPGLADLLPPFGAAHRAAGDHPVVVAGDWLGFRQLFWWQGDGVAAVSTSAVALAALGGTGLDTAALGVQSLLGWQLGLGTVFRGVTKLAPGSAAVLHHGRLTIGSYGGELPAPHPPTRAAGPHRRDAVVDEMARILRRWLPSYLGDHPDAVLQLTGGHDSRILLGAVPADMRPGLRALTLDGYGGPDATIAARLSHDCGLRHHVHWLDDQPPPTPAEAHQLARAAAAHLDCMASPLALAPLALAERGLEQGHRLSGLGGEVARGFYYTGQPRAARTSPRLVDRLARWRLFSNEAVTPDALAPDFTGQARGAAATILSDLFDGYSADWLRATDEFYLHQRMHRWGGAHGSVAAGDRVFVNPMFDREFLALALTADPADKRDSRLLGRLMYRLDPALAAVALDSGLTPAQLGRGNAATRVAVATRTARRASRTIRQRLTGGGRPQLGAAGMAALVVAHWRAAPDTVAALRGTGLVRDAWLDGLLDGRHDAAPQTVAFLVNLLVAADASAPADDARGLAAPGGWPDQGPLPADPG